MSVSAIVPQTETKAGFFQRLQKALAGKDWLTSTQIREVLDVPAGSDKVYGNTTIYSALLSATMEGILERKQLDETAQGKMAVKVYRLATKKRTQQGLFPLANHQEFYDLLADVVKDGPKAYEDIMEELGVSPGTLVAGRSSFSTAIGNGVTYGHVVRKTVGDKRLISMGPKYVPAPKADPPALAMLPLQPAIKTEAVARLGDVVKAVKEASAPAMQPEVAVEPEPTPEATVESVDDLLTRLSEIQVRGRGLVAKARTTDGELAKAMEALRLAEEAVARANEARNTAFRELTDFRTSLAGTLGLTGGVVEVVEPSVPEAPPEEEDDPVGAFLSPPAPVVTPPSTTTFEKPYSPTGETFDGKWMWAKWCNSVAYNLKCANPSRYKSAHAEVCTALKNAVPMVKKITKWTEDEVLGYAVKAMMELEREYATRQRAYKFTSYYDTFAQQVPDENLVVIS